MVTDASSQNGAMEQAISIPAADLTRDRFSIGRDVLNRAVEELPPCQRAPIEWFWRYCQQRNIGRDRMAELLLKPNGDFYSPDSIYQLLTGKRMEQGANIAPMLKAIEDFRQQVQPRVGLDVFFETRLHREIKQYFDRAMRLERIGWVFGKMSIGKTTSFRKIAEDDPACLYTQMPTRGTYSDYLRECAKKSAMSVRQAVQKLRDRVLDGLPKKIIVDDADECFASTRNSWGIASLQFLKEAYDRKPRGFLIGMDDWGRDELLHGEHAERLGRLWRRRIAPLQLPEVPYPEDLALFADSVGLLPAPEAQLAVDVKYHENGKERMRRYTDSPARLENDICAKSGVGVWLTMLRDAVDLAKESRRPISWGAVLKVHALDAAMEERAGVKRIGK